MNIIIRRFFAFLLSCALVFGSVQSSYAAAAGGWSATAADATIAGATATIKAFRGRGAAAMQSVISHKPTAINIGKNLAKGGGALALAFAASQLLDAGIDWVMTSGGDIKYTEKVPVSGTGYTYETQGIVGSSDIDSCKAWIAQAGSNAVNNYKNPRITKPVDENAAFGNYSGGRQGKSFTCSYDYYSSVQSVSGVRFGTTAPTYEDGQEKTIPAATVGAKVISNAEAGHAPSQDFVKAVAVGVANSGALDTELEAAATPTTDTPTADPVEPAKPFDDSSIIAAIKSVMTAVADMSGALGAKFDALMVEMGLQNDKTIEAIETAEAARAADAQAAKEAAEAKAAADAEFQDWVKEEAPPLDDDTALDIPNDDISPVSTDINFGGACPANFEVNSSIFGNPINIVLLDTAKFCGFLSTFVKYPVYAVSSLFALYILGGRKDV